MSLLGMSREKLYKWKRRFDELGAAGLANRPTTPHSSPNATPKPVVSRVLYLRQNYHFGAGRIRDYLKRFHEIRIAGQTVQNILCEHGLGPPPANQSTALAFANEVIRRLPFRIHVVQTGRGRLV